MHPAFSVLVFTVTSGFGYGLMIMLIIAQWLGGSVFSNPTHYLLALAAALILITAGLLSSTLHLANPKNAWRAFSRFRTSWLSKEGVYAIAYYPLVLTYIFVLWRNDFANSLLLIVLGLACIALALVLTYCTAMIYASLKTIPQWYTQRVPFGFVLFCLFSGLLSLNATQSMVDEPIATAWLIVTALLALIGIAFKIQYFRFVGQPSATTINSATTFTEARVRLFDTGHSSANFLQKEFYYVVGPKTKTLARRLTIAFAFTVPLFLLVVQLLSSSALVWPAVAAALSCYLGLLLERWLFFVEAKHVVRRYYGEQH